MERFKEWLNEIVDHQQDTLAPIVRVARHERLAWLVACNGGTFTVRGWGVVGFSGGPFREGLHQHEAIELIEYGAFISGVECGAGDPSPVLRPLLEGHIKRWTDEYEKQVA